MLNVVFVYVRDVLSLCAGAQESLSDKETLKPCEGYDLSRVNTPQDYQAVANSTESLEKIEDCMRSWIKQIEQVSYAVFVQLFNNEMQEFINRKWEAHSDSETGDFQVNEIEYL